MDGLASRPRIIQPPIHGVAMTEVVPPIPRPESQSVLLNWRQSSQPWGVVHYALSIRETSIPPGSPLGAGMLQSYANQLGLQVGAWPPRSNWSTPLCRQACSSLAVSSRWSGKIGPDPLGINICISQRNRRKRAELHPLVVQNPIPSA